MQLKENGRRQPRHRLAHMVLAECALKTAKLTSPRVLLNHIFFILYLWNGVIKPAQRAHIFQLTLTLEKWSLQLVKRMHRGCMKSAANKLREESTERSKAYQVSFFWAFPRRQKRDKISKNFIQESCEWPWNWKGSGDVCKASQIRRGKAWAEAPAKQMCWRDEMSQRTSEGRHSKDRKALLSATPKTQRVCRGRAVYLKLKSCLFSLHWLVYTCLETLRTDKIKSENNLVTCPRSQCY